MQGTKLKAGGGYNLKAKAKANAVKPKKTVETKKMHGNKQQKKLRKAVYSSFENKIIGLATKEVGGLRVVKPNDPKHVEHMLRTASKETTKKLKKMT